MTRVGRRRLVEVVYVQLPHETLKFRVFEVQGQDVGGEHVHILYFDGLSVYAPTRYAWRSIVSTCWMSEETECSVRQMRRHDVQYKAV